jgi:hypothetical protein
VSSIKDNSRQVLSNSEEFPQVFLAMTKKLEKYAKTVKNECFLRIERNLRFG